MMHKLQYLQRNDEINVKQQLIVYGLKIHAKQREFSRDLPHMFFPISILK